jgi:molybdopterin-guanine dinucleotide biosynthesis protein A
MAAQSALAAVVLAGGRSSRMGRDKAALDFDGLPLLERTITELRTFFDPVLAVAGAEPVLTPQFAQLGTTVVRDDAPFAGPVGAVARGLIAASADSAFVCACDLPFLTAGAALKICGVLGAHEAVIPRVDGHLQPLFAAYSSACAEKLNAMAASGETRLWKIAECVDARILSEAELDRLGIPALTFFNVNTEEDYSKALALFREKRAG